MDNYVIRELEKKIDALLGLLIAMGRGGMALPWTKDWVAGFLSGFDLSEQYIAALTGMTNEEVRKEKTKAKMREVRRKPSFLDRFKED
jgi:hypothetical protein